MKLSLAGSLRTYWLNVTVAVFAPAFIGVALEVFSLPVVAGAMFLAMFGCIVWPHIWGRAPYSFAAVCFLASFFLGGPIAGTILYAIFAILGWPTPKVGLG